MAYTWHVKSIQHGRFVSFAADPADRLLRCPFAEDDAPPGDWIALAVGNETGPVSSYAALGKSGSAEELAAWVATLPSAMCATGNVDGANGGYQAWAVIDPETRSGYVECWIDSDQERAVGRYSVSEVSSLKEALFFALHEAEAEGAGILGERPAPKRAFKFQITAELPAASTTKQATQRRAVGRKPTAQKAQRSSKPRGVQGRTQTAKKSKQPAAKKTRRK